jgi:hypothetical protein
MPDLATAVVVVAEAEQGTVWCQEQLRLASNVGLWTSKERAVPFNGTPDGAPAASYLTVTVWPARGEKRRLIGFEMYPLFCTMFSERRRAHNQFISGPVRVSSHSSTGGMEEPNLYVVLVLSKVTLMPYEDARELSLSWPERSKCNRCKEPCSCCCSTSRGAF